LKDAATSRYNRAHRREVLAAVAVIGFVATANRAPAQDQPALQSQAHGIEDVFITAQKQATAQRAQTAPLSVTAIGAAQLNERQAYKLTNLATVAPNVTLADAGTMPGFANFTIRGLGINSTIPSIEPAVGVFVNGIYQGMSAGSVLELFDVESIEILRGPQATLFGRNTTGGALLVNTRKPGDQFAVHGRASVESGLQKTLGLSIEGPIRNGIKGKIAASFDDDDGWFENSLDGKSLGVRRGGFVRPMVVWAPNASFDATVTYEHGWTGGNGPVAQNPAYSRGFSVNIGNPGYNKMNRDAVTLEANWRTGEGAVTALFGYQRLGQRALADIDAQPASRFHAENILKQHQFSGEIRYSGKLSGRIGLTAGLYYFTQSYLYLERRMLAGGLVDSTMGGAIVDNHYAAFAQADYRVTSEFGLIAGGRFVSERKSAAIATFVPSTAASRCDFAVQTCAFNFPGPGFAGVPGTETWTNFVPKLGFEWDPNDELLFYGHWTRGIRGGGYNVRSTASTIPPGPYGPELQDAFEAGIKSDWLDGRLRVNGAAFHSTIANMQRDVNFSDPLVGVVQATRNTADATIKGAELELTAAPVRDFLLFGNFGYTDGRYNRVFFDLDGGGIGSSDLGLSIPRLSKWSYNFGAAYTRGIGDEYTIGLRAEYGHRTRAAATDGNTAFLAPIRNLSASASLTLPGRHWTLSVYGRNLLNVVTEGLVTPLPRSLGGGAFRPLNEGRVVGVQAAFVY